MTEYVIHADDFGISESVNACIGECFRKGWLSETSLMVNMPACDAAVQQAQKDGYAHRVGLHLNLSQGHPLTQKIRAFPRFCNPDGTFNKLFHMSPKGRFSLSVNEQDAVRDEIEAQLDKFCSYSGLMRRIDSHHHVHTDWSIFRILKPIALRHGFTAMRITADLHKVRLDKRFYKIWLNQAIRKTFITTDHFDGICDRLLASPGGVVEVMVHPLDRNGVLCDTKTPYGDQMNRILRVRDSKIRGI